MAQFIDLSDEIGADDWIIPDGDVLRKRLIKQTARHNIYKADWFGDVLVYESRQTKGKTKENRNLDLKQLGCVISDSSNRSSLDEFTCSLSRLDLTQTTAWSKIKSRSQNSLASDGCDSAYSSASSTPQYHTKNHDSEFKFPSQLHSPIMSFESPPVSRENSLDSSTSELFGSFDLPLWFSTMQEKNTGENRVKQANRPLLLNRDSYNFSHSGLEKATDEGLSSHSSWTELNELRLIAHESFMLFMGASMSDQLDGQIDHSTSLVIQMNHSKAVSLFNLLHGSATQSQSTNG